MGDRSAWSRAGVVLVLASGVGAAGCSTSPGHSSTTTTSRAPATTTTDGLPVAPQSSAPAAAAALVNSWATGNRPAALSVATPQAVATLFAIPYPRGLAIDRGCSTDFSPIICTYGPPGGAPPSDPIYQIDVTQTAAGWYVSSATVEG